MQAGYRSARSTMPSLAWHLRNERRPVGERCQILQGFQLPKAKMKGVSPLEHSGAKKKPRAASPFYSDAFFVREISYPKTSAHRASILKEGWLCPLST
jgi:hypothetical protein